MLWQALARRRGGLGEGAAARVAGGVWVVRRGCIRCSVLVLLANETACECAVSGATTVSGNGEGLLLTNKPLSSGIYMWVLKTNLHLVLSAGCPHH